MFKRHAPYYMDKAIFGTTNYTADASVTIQSESVGLNKLGVKAVPPGLFVVDVNGETRFLPRDKARDNIVTTSNVVKVNYPELFKVGDVLYTLEPKCTITLSGTFVANNSKILIEVSEPSLGIRVAYTYTVGTSTVLADIANGIKTALNSTTNPLSKYLRAEATGAAVDTYSSGLVYNLRTEVTGGGTATVGTMDSNPKIIGTVQAVKHESQELVLTGNATQAVSMGGRFGTMIEKVYGIYNHSVDFTDRSSCTVAAVSCCDSVYSAALPYFDLELMARLPRLNFI